LACKYVNNYQLNYWMDSSS